MRKGFKHTVKLLAAGIICILCSQQTNAQHTGTDYPAGTPVNFVRTWDATAPEQDANNLITRPVKDVKQATQYFDGLGRPLQTVIKQGSFATGGTATDMVSPVEYDAFGREQYKYLPFVANNYGGNTSIADGAFKLNPFAQQVSFMTNQYGTQGETYFYSKTNFEASPLNRPTDTYAPGSSWAGSEANAPALQRNVQVKYFINTVTDDVKIWIVTDNATLGVFGTYATAISYPAGQLYKNITVDEHKKQVIEFKDKEGKVILKKVQLTAVSDDGTGSGYPGWLCTYYIYDDLNNLRCVIQPEAVRLMNSAGNWDPSTYLAEQCFRYEYDQRNRMIKKKVPGAAAVCMVYDARDRLVLTQDGNLATLSKWMYTTYDELNSPVATGLWPSALTWDQHANNAAGSTIYPASVMSGEEELTRTFYDDYGWLATNGNPFATTRSTLDDGNFNAASTSYPYYQALTQSNALKGMPTGSKIKVLGTASTYLYSISYYDDKGRVLQSQSQNITTGTDISTTQYNWAGQPMMSVLRQQKNGSNPQTNIVLSQLTYDDLGRVTKTEKKVSNTLVNGGALPNVFTTTAEMQYDALGQLKNKKLGRQKDAGGNYTTTPIETLAYDYNIRGWLLGTNRNYLTTTGQNGSTKFGFELGYDKLTGSSGRNFTAAQYNGNINGMAWKSDGDDVKRKYDFTYDAVNRLLKGQFEQDDATNTWNSTTMNYSMQMGDGNDPTSAYDANGNIKGMTQFGWKIGASPTTPIDNLKYTYITGTNKLKSVTDFNNDATTKLGDFKTNATHPQAATKTGLTAGSTPAQFDAITDYSYDVNGNLNLDNNKAISSITYNHLNLPSVITVTGKGNITYTYDAGGNKIKKQTIESPVATNGNKTITTTTTYIGGMVYESKTSLPANTPNDDYTDRLQFIGQEEGRIRFKPAVGGTLASLQYDYMLKDHLGNVRMVLTEEQQVDQYPAATMETATATTEETFYSNLPTTRTTLPTGYPANTPAGNQRVAKVKAAAGSQKIGPAIILKVMAGDKFNLMVNSWWKSTSTPGLPVSPVNELIAALSGNISAASGGKASSTELINSGLSGTAANSFLNSQSGYNATRPKAFINWVVLDEQFKIVNSSSGFEQVGATNTYTTHVRPNLTVDKSGYLYIYVSNETPNIDVFFDNLQVTHVRGAILEETHYYPFGLPMAGISSKAAGMIENKKKYNSYEYNTDFDLNWNESYYRTHDPQLGRFLQIDPKPSYDESPFAAMGNNPIKYNDLLGDKYKLNGSDDDKKAYLEYLHDLTGNTYKLNKKGEIVRVNKKLNTKTTDKVSGRLSKLVDKAIRSKETITMNLRNDEKTDKGVGFDVAASGTVDMRDLAKVKEFSKESGDNAYMAGIVGHFINELMLLPGAKQQDATARQEAHNASLKVDGQIVTEMLGIPNAERTQGPVDRQSTPGQSKYPAVYGQVQYVVPFQTTVTSDGKTRETYNTWEIVGRIIKIDNSQKH